MIVVSCDDSLCPTEVVAPLEIILDVFSEFEHLGLRFTLSSDSTVRLPPGLFQRLVQILDGESHPPE